MFDNIVIPDKYIISHDLTVVNKIKELRDSGKKFKDIAPLFNMTESWACQIYLKHFGKSGWMRSKVSLDLINKVMIMRSEQDMTYQAIADELSITRQYAHTIYNRYVCGNKKAA